MFVSGDKVVCVDDSGKWKDCPLPWIKKDVIYCVDEILSEPSYNGVLGITLIGQPRCSWRSERASWNINRFRKIEIKFDKVSKKEEIYA